MALIEVEVGIRWRAARPAVGRHPVHVVHAARASNFRALLIQYPSPPPRKSAPDQQWMRLRIGVPYRRDDSLAGLRRFLTEVRRLQEAGSAPLCEVNVQIVPEMSTFDATATAPEETFARSSSPARAHPSGGQAGLHAVLGDEVEVPGLEEGSVWRPLALCAPARQD